MSTGGLGASASKGAAATLAGQAARVIVQLAGIVILARLLAPSDYGLIAMVMAIIGIGEIFRDFGLSSAAIQAETLSKAQKDNLFWINTGIGALLTGIVAACSGPIAAFYGDPRLQPLTVALSLTFFLHGVSTQFRADLNRNLKFLRLSAAEVIAQVLGLVVGIVMAVSGLGFWSLAGQQVSQVVFQIVVLVIVTRWFPGGITRGVPMKGFLTFGVNLFGAQALGYASRNVAAIVIGAQLGARPLGLYNRAFQLMLLPLNQINAPSTRVALPVLSRLQNQPERFAAFVSFGQVVMLNLATFVLAFCGAQGFAIVSIALGNQWLESVPIFQILLIAGFFQVASYVIYWIFLAKGLTRSNLMYSLATRPAMIVVILIGSYWGLYGVVWAYALSIALMWPIGLWWIGRASGVSSRVLFLNGLRTIIVYAVATALSYASTVAMPEDALVLRLVVGGVALVAALGLIALIWPAYRRDVVSIANARQYLRRNRPGKGDDAGEETISPGEGER